MRFGSDLLSVHFFEAGFSTLFLVGIMVLSSVEVSNVHLLCQVREAREIVLSSVRCSKLWAVLRYVPLFQNVERFLHFRDGGPFH